MLPALPGVTLDRPVAACPLDTAGSPFNLPTEGRAREQAREGGGYRSTLTCEADMTQNLQPECVSLDRLYEISEGTLWVSFDLSKP